MATILEAVLGKTRVDFAALCAGRRKVQVQEPYKETDLDDILRRIEADDPTIVAPGPCRRCAGRAAARLVGN